MGFPPSVVNGWITLASNLMADVPPANEMRGCTRGDIPPLLLSGAQYSKPAGVAKIETRTKIEKNLQEASFASSEGKLQARRAGGVRPSENTYSLALRACNRGLSN
jgi:hypothetical protein